MIALDALEQQLADAYRSQASHYDEALRIVNESGQACEPDGWAQDLQSVLQQVATMDERMVSDKLAWHHSGRKPGANLRGILEELQVKIHTLAVAIDRRSGELLARKQRLLPALDEFIRQRQMLSRYEQFGKAK